jgi:WD40 repeat protein
MGYNNKSKIFPAFEFLNFNLKAVAIGSEYGDIRIYNYSNSYIQSFQAHSSWVNRIKQSPFNSNYVATCSDDKTVKIWMVSVSTSEWSLFRTYSQHSSAVYALEWLDADTMASCGFNNDPIKIWSLSAGQTKRVINVTNSPFVLSLKLLFSSSSSSSSSSSHLAASLNESINIYNLNDDTLVSTLRGHSDWVWDLAQLNANTLASSSGDFTVIIWDLESNSIKFTLQGHTSNVYVLKKITPTVLASGSQDETIKLWDITNGKLVSTLKGHTGGIVRSLDLMDNGQTLVCGSWSQTIKKWKWSTEEQLSTIRTFSNIRTLAVID